METAGEPRPVCIRLTAPAMRLGVLVKAYLADINPGIVVTAVGYDCN
jgi:hypothetical protein